MGGILHVLLTTSLVALQLSTELIVVLCSAGAPKDAKKS